MTDGVLVVVDVRPGCLRQQVWAKAEGCRPVADACDREPGGDALAALADEVGVGVNVAPDPVGRIRRLALSRTPLVPGWKPLSSGPWWISPDVWKSLAVTAIGLEAIPLGDQFKAIVGLGGRQRWTG